MTKLRLGRLSESSQFEAMLRLAPVVVSPHFALYYRKAQPAGGVDLSGGTPESLLLTAKAGPGHRAVDNVAVQLGIVVPKRLSRRAVTRSLLKRQIRAAAARQLGQLKPGLWIVRQRTAFQSAVDGSAASDVLKLEARLELDRLLEKVRHAQGGPAH